MKYDYIIGIDTGTNTGVAVWDTAGKRFIEIRCEKIHKAFNLVHNYHHERGKILVRVEDARQRKWFGNAGRSQLQGAGSIKRDATIWNDFLDDLGCDFEMVAPKNNTTKLPPDTFRRITGVTILTEREAKKKGYNYPNAFVVNHTTDKEHCIDAAMLVYGY
ncbi:MAG: hypothetical protein LBR64_02285 [Dysgonamonadaceae bacterium]|jgi:hypothetical protein|nr:hypothetical protein [Dysgonamonadaceae bacterium]